MKIFIRKGLYIFNYHSFNTFVNDYWKFGSIFFSNYQKNFEKQVQFYLKYLNKVETFNLKEISYTKPLFFLTFDDGYRDNFEIALPILKKYSLPSIFLITTGLIGTENLLWHDKVRLFFEKRKNNNLFNSMHVKRECKRRLNQLKKKRLDVFAREIEEIPEFQNRSLRLMMDWTQVHELYHNKFLIGIHSHTHPVMSALDFNQQVEEIKKSIELIRENLNYNPIFCSYPEGTSSSYGSDTIEILKKFGIQYSFTTVCGLNQRETNPYRLKRIGVNPSDPVPLLAVKILKATAKNIWLKSEMFNKCRYSLKQYGFFYSVKRFAKHVLKPLGINIDTYYILHRNLDEDIKIFSLPEKMEIKQMNYKDFENSEFFTIYPEQKRELYRKRFKNDDYQAFGVKIKGKFVYMTWISTDSIEIKAINFKKKLTQDEAVLVDSYALPEARGLGIHNFMNGYRLRKLKEKGIKKVYAGVLSENRPALKTQLKYGFKKGEKITWLRIGRFEKYFKKAVDFK
ncbi:MAG: polysaccharide deacetylase family protein [Promethearchaeota archaeon]